MKSRAKARTLLHRPELMKYIIASLLLFFLAGLFAFHGCSDRCLGNKEESKMGSMSSDISTVLSGRVDAMSTSSIRLRVLTGGVPPGTPFKEEMREVKVSTDVLVEKMEGIKDRKTIEKEMSDYQKLLKSGTTTQAAPDFSLYKNIHMFDIRVGDDVGVTTQYFPEVGEVAIKIVLLPRRAF